MRRFDDRSPEALKGRRWYSLARWKRRRLDQLSGEPTCRFCRLQGFITAATVADHVEPHRFDEEAFWNGDLQSLCKPCHDTHKQRLESGHGYLSWADLSGYPTDPNHIQNVYARRQTDRDLDRQVKPDE